MAFRSVISSKMPMVIILGATGTGKTKLSLEVAKKFKTEVISADSMQIYKGLDIVTAKATPEERRSVPHHLIDILEPHQMFTVVDFRNRALQLINNLTEQGKMPLIVGGTNYYLESIVYNILVEDMDDVNALLWDKSKRKRDECEIEERICKKSASKCETTLDTNTAVTVHENTKDISKIQIQKDVDNEKMFTNEEIHARLKKVDPVMAARLHPNNRRKVLRSIEVWLKTGRLHSELLEEQKHREGQLRRPGATVIFWLKCEQAIHDKRLNDRVDSMLQEGLINELLDFHDRHNKQRIKDGTAPDYTKGVFQTLGFKEFHEYLMLPEERRNSDEGRKLLLDSVENMKMATRRFARRQNKMVRARFLEHPTREIPPIYELDTTDPSKWEQEVLSKALHIIESFISNTKCLYEPLTPTDKLESKKNIDTHSSNYCNVCERLIIGDKQFSIHLNSNRHTRALKKKKKMAAKDGQYPAS